MINSQESLSIWHPLPSNIEIPFPFITNLAITIAIQLADLAAKDWTPDNSIYSYHSWFRSLFHAHLKRKIQTGGLRNPANQFEWNFHQYLHGFMMFYVAQVGSSCLRPLLQAASFPWFCMESWCKTASARSKSSRLRSLVRRQATFQIESIHLFMRDVLTITGGANPGVTWPSCVLGLAPSASLQYLGHLDAQAFTCI